ncbi:atrial natriuretic peptide receptor 2-like [Hyposmocoma kahamanoa]|uniref:atrial natriuretic peptide receptor 2-like n=1 Tax=Hyposmocoma kahamanoa TaxID=1477025 RepID=UPI000E6D9BD4|nr:atrial natriuretic peptide receptor 2-like [Hyposmocoma kahamanoa]
MRVTSSKRLYKILAASRKLTANYEFLFAMEELSLALISVADLETQEQLVIYAYHQALGIEHLGATLQFLQAENRAEFQVLDEVLDFYKQFPLVRNESLEEVKSGAWMTYYILESQDCINKLKLVQTRLWDFVQQSVRREVWLARQTLAIGVAILTIVLLASPVLVLLIRHTVNTIQTFNRSIEISTQRLMLEKQKSDILLSRMLPLPVLRRLKAQRSVPAESFDAVTIFFSDIVGFTTLSANSSPMEVINMLNMLYRLFDDKIMQYNVYKVETIGDAYMVVSGLPQRNGNRHASEIADMALALMRGMEGATVPHRPEEPLRIRAGVNTGPCVAGVVGTTMPRYCLFGDTINVASRMESTGEAMKIHISYSTKMALDQIGGYEIQPRGEINVAGKGTMETFWLVRKINNLESESPQELKLHDYDQNVHELLILN